MVDRSMSSLTSLTCLSCGAPAQPRRGKAVVFCEACLERYEWRPDTFGRSEDQRTKAGNVRRSVRLRKPRENRRVVDRRFRLGKVLRAEVGSLRHERGIGSRSRCFDVPARWTKRQPIPIVGNLGSAPHAKLGATSVLGHCRAPFYDSPRPHRRSPMNLSLITDEWRMTFLSHYGFHPRHSDSPEQPRSGEPDLMNLVGARPDDHVRIALIELERANAAPQQLIGPHWTCLA